MSQATNSARYSSLAVTFTTIVKKLLNCEYTGFGFESSLTAFCPFEAGSATFLGEYIAG